MKDLQKEFEQKVRRRVWQLKRSKLFRKKIEEEMGEGEWSKEKAQKFIEETIPTLAKEEYLKRMDTIIKDA